MGVCGSCLYLPALEARADFLMVIMKCFIVTFSLVETIKNTLEKAIELTAKDKKCTKYTCFICFILQPFLSFLSVFFFLSFCHLFSLGVFSFYLLLFFLLLFLLLLFFIHSNYSLLFYSVVFFPFFFTSFIVTVSCSPTWLVDTKHFLGSSLISI